MPWSKNRYACMRCRRPRTVAGKISARGLCAQCRDLAMQAELEQLVAHSGPHFDHWLRQCRRAFGLAIADDA